MEREINKIIEDVANEVTSNVKSTPVVWKVETKFRYDDINYRDYTLVAKNRLYYVKFKEEIYYGIDTSELENNPDNYSLFNKAIPGTKGVKWTKNKDNLIKYLTYLFEIVNDYTKRMLKKHWDIDMYYNFEEGLLDIENRTKESKKKGKIDKLEETRRSIDANIKEREDSIESSKNDIQRLAGEIFDFKKKLEEVDKELNEIK